MISNRTLKVTLAFVAAMVTIAAPPVSGSAKKKPIFFKIKSGVTIESRGFPTPATYSFEGGTSAGGAGFQLSRCRFGRTVRLHYVIAMGDQVVGTTTSARPPEGGTEGRWEIEVPRPGISTQVYAEVPKRKVRHGTCKRAISQPHSLTG